MTDQTKIIIGFAVSLVVCCVPFLWILWQDILDRRSRRKARKGLRTRIGASDLESIANRASDKVDRDFCKAIGFDPDAPPAIIDHLGCDPPKHAESEE